MGDTDTQKTFLRCSSHPKLPRNRGGWHGFILTQPESLSLRNRLEPTPSTDTLKKQLVLDIKRWGRRLLQSVPTCPQSLPGTVRSDSVSRVISVHPLSSRCRLFRWADSAWVLLLLLFFL